MNIKYCSYLVMKDVWVVPVPGSFLASHHVITSGVHAIYLNPASNFALSAHVATVASVATFANVATVAGASHEPPMPAMRIRSCEGGTSCQEVGHHLPEEGGLKNL